MTPTDWAGGPGSMMCRTLFLAALCLVLPAGCGGGPPDRDEILVATTPPGASCTLTRLGQPIGSIASSPAIVLAEPHPDAIDVSCSRPGFAEATATLPPPPETWLGFGGGEHQRRVDLVLTPGPQRLMPR